MNKRLSIIVTIIALFIAFSADAQLLWKISGNGLSKPSYLFGTHHLIAKEQIKGFDTIMALCEKANAVVGEMDMSDPTLKMKMVQGGMMKDTTINELLTPDDYNLADYEFKQLIQVGLAQLETMKPMMLDMMYSVMIYSKAMGLCKQPEGVDILFQEKAKANNKKVIGLETIEEEMNVLFNDIPLKRQAAILMKDIKEKQQGIEQMKELNVAYLAGNMAKTEALAKQDDTLTPAEEKLMMDDRNTHWMKELPTLMNAQSCFIDVGFMHLIGKSGLISQLKKAGYTVEPMPL
jgi:uncharacterized protein YbaP (TraB family)